MQYKYKGTGDFQGLIFESALPIEDWKFGTEILVRSDQPDSSKREDFDLTKLADQFIDEWEMNSSFNSYEEAYIAGTYDFSDWLKQRCGTRNTQVTE